LQQVASALKEHGATIVAITPQLAEASRSLIEKQRISFDLLSDPGNAYAAKLGLRFTLPDDLKGVYLSFGNDLAVRNGEGSWTLPMPGRFVIDRGGIVRAADVDPDYEHRPEPQKTIDDVKALAYGGVSFASERRRLRRAFGVPPRR
jgi:peroxiredoxin